MVAILAALMEASDSGVAAIRVYRCFILLGDVPIKECFD
jgi:hypothetical protein